MKRRRMIKTVKRIFVLASSVLALACGDAQNEFSSARCFFVFDNAVHQNSVLSAAMTPRAHVFATVKKTTTWVGGHQVIYLSFTSNQGGQTEASKANAVDLKRSILLGLGNGLVVGYGHLSDPLTFYAYDLECPNCFSAEVIPQKDFFLTIDGNGTATCSTCRRQYDLNNGGIITAGDRGHKLIRYRASTSGPLGVLAVN